MLMVDASATLWSRYRGWKTASSSKIERKALEAVSAVFPGIRSGDVTFMRLIMEHILFALDSVADRRRRRLGVVDSPRDSCMICLRVVRSP